MSMFFCFVFKTYFLTRRVGGPFIFCMMGSLVACFKNLFLRMILILLVVFPSFTAFPVSDLRARCARLSSIFEDKTRYGLSRIKLGR